ncbi:D-2-hydroxyacid dehydrogenase [Xanthobacter wiegelii]|uniref:D-2-hydroxyacid dehydrogenase n=1 Tax=Xanthobacter wiegelii TaxID=3119913 RepID=UPI0037291E84
MHRIVVLDRDTIAPEVNVRRPSFPHEWVEYDRTSASEVIERAKDATIIINNKVDLRADTLAQLPHLKLIAIAATGTDCVDKTAATAQGVPTVNIRGYAKATVPEHTFALLLSLARSIVPYRAEVLEGAWQAAQQFCFFTNPIVDLAGRRLGIVGAGVLGSQVAGIARAFGMDVVFYDPMAKPGTVGVVSLDELIETSHAITLHCPLTDETRGMFDMAAFRRMKNRPILINTARGGLIVEEDLEIALDEGLVSAAGLDVTLPEPPAPDSAFMRLARRRNVICTPHIAWASLEAQQALADQLIDNIENFVAGRPTNVVSPD